VIKTRYLSIFLFLPEPLYTCDPTGQVLLTGPQVQYVGDRVQIPSPARGGRSNGRPNVRKYNRFRL
jgi:hypothetical protein